MIFPRLIYLFLPLLRDVSTECRIVVPWSSHFNFWTKKCSAVSVSNIGRDIAFYECSEIKWKRSFAVFIVYATIFWQFTVAFHFFLLHKKNRSLHTGPSEKVSYLTLNLSNWHSTSSWKGPTSLFDPILVEMSRYTITAGMDSSHAVSKRHLEEN